MRPDARSIEDALQLAVAEVVGQDGYAELTVERLLTAAGVSRASFYQYFLNVEDCFWSAYRRHAEELVCVADAAAAGDGPRELDVLEALAVTAISSPRIAWLLMCEGLAVGREGLSERDALISRIERAMKDPTTSQPVIDLPLTIMIGGVFRFLSMRIADGGPLDGLAVEVRQWAGAFARRCSRSLWSSSFALASPQHAYRPAERAKPVHAAGSPRERILRATASTVREQGYRAITVADIASAAGVSRRSFYNEFPSKSAAFTAVYEDTFQRTLAVCTPAFFKPGAWPERVWSGVQASTRLLAREPASAYLGFVEPYAIGPSFASRVHDMQLAFTIFLEDGYRQRPEARALTRACSTLTATAIFETGFQASRHGTSLHIHRMQPLAVYIALAPFIGRNAAGEFVTRRLSASAHAAAR
jgi:AcrR family transcriptional regulator